MISRILISGSAGMILFLGSVHLSYTFLTHKFSPTEKQLETAMKQVAPRFSGETTMWRVWIGIHFSHSMGLMLFGLHRLLLRPEAMTTALLPPTR
jgi:hypothetical protein